MSGYRNLLNKKAVALSYNEEKNRAPVVIASGMGYMAEKIVEVAGEHGIPVYEDESLATILTQLELGSEIPEELYQAVVDIYAFFLRFGEKKEGQRPEAPAEKAPVSERGQAAAPETLEEAADGGGEPVA